MSHVLVTGGTGCIGAVVVRDLLARGVDRVVVATRSSDSRRIGMWLDGADPRVAFAPVDLGDSAAVRAVVREQRPSHCVHLGALQSPDCDRDPELGMRVNVGGTLALFEACSELASPLQRLVFASSAAVYGPRSLYPGPTVAESATLAPPNRYGVWKVAGESLARLFHQSNGVPTVCLRLNTTYGPGRDLGMTSAPTTALKCIAEGHARGEILPFRMPYRGRENYHYVEDVGAHFVAAALEPFEGFEACNIRGETVEVAQFLETAASVAAELGMGDSVDVGIATDARENLFVSDLDDMAIVSRFPGVPKTPLRDGIRVSLARFLDREQRCR